MEHGLKYIAFYVLKHITHCTVVITSLLVRDKPLEAPASVKRACVLLCGDPSTAIIVYIYMYLREILATFFRYFFVVFTMLRACILPFVVPLTDYSTPQWKCQAVMSNTMLTLSEAL